MNGLVLQYATTFNVSLEKAKLEIEKIKEAFNKIYDSIKNIVVRACEIFNMFLKNNPWIIKYILKDYKYQKRINNRNELYKKRKKLGRKL